MSVSTNVGSSFSAVETANVGQDMSAEVVALVVAPVVEVGASVEKPKSEIDCRYAGKCYTAGCEYKHPEGYTPGPAVCRYGGKCRVSGCPRVHPETRSAPKAMMMIPGGKMVPVIGFTEEGFPVLGSIEVKPGKPIWVAKPSAAAGGGGESEVKEPEVKAKKQCRHTACGRDCFDRTCEFAHPVGYNPGPKMKCRKAGKCKDKECLFAHPTDPEWASL